MKCFRLNILTAFLFACTTMQLIADVNVLIIGSTRDSGERHRAAGSWEDEKPLSDPTSAPFSPTAIGAYLDNILSGAGLGSVNVTVEERYRYQSLAGGWGGYAYDLATWFHFPYPDGSESSRWANLRGESGTQWDYVVLIGDPYNIEYTPGVYAHGVAKVAEEVAKGSAETILLMPWPGSGSDSSLAHYKEVVYRVGRSGGFKVAPAGLAWQACGSPSGGSHPNNNGAYIAAATIYSRIYRQSARVSSYSYNDTNADTANTTVNNNVGQPQYSGTFNFQNPYLMLGDKRREVHFSERGTSTEQGIKTRFLTALDRCKVSYVYDYCDSYTSNTPEDDGAGWPTGRSMPIAMNWGRSGLWAEDYKAYVLNPSYWQLGFGFYYQSGAWFNDPDIYTALMQQQDNDLANRMTIEGSSARNLPLRTLWASVYQDDPTAKPMVDTVHLNYATLEAAGAFVYTLYSGRCPVDLEPGESETNWKADKIGYETAWHMGRCQARAPGFKVMPASATASDVTPTATQTMTVQFILPPRANVTVNVSTDDRTAGTASPSTLTFTPANYSNAQAVTVMGATGSAGVYDFDVLFATSSGDEVYDGLSDRWAFVNTRPEGPPPSELRILGNGITVFSGDTEPEIDDGTYFGVVDSSVSRTFTIENLSDSQTITLTDNPPVELTGANGHFSITENAAASSLGPGATTAFEITCDPSVAGTHTATVWIASSDSAIPNYSFAVSGLRPGAPSVENRGATPEYTKSATLSGAMTAGGVSEGWICWGTTDGGTESTSDWDNVDAIGSLADGDEFSFLAQGFEDNITYWYRCHVSNSAGVGWSQTATSFSGKANIPGGIWQPTEVELACWLDASDTDSVVLNSGNVRTLVDKSGNSMDAAQTTASEQPLYKASDSRLNNMGSIYSGSSGAGDYLLTPSFGARRIYGIMYYADGLTTPFSGHNGVITGPGSSDAFRLTGRTGGEDWDPGGQFCDDNVWKNGDDTVDARNAILPMPNTMWIFNSTALRTQTWRILAGSVTAYSCWIGGVGELIFTDGNESTEERQKIEGYLAHKWGLAADLPGTHTYKDVAPGGAGLIINCPPSDITGSSAMLSGAIEPEGTSYDVYLHWGPSDGGSNASSWASSASIGTFSSLADMSNAVSGLTAGQTYYYTFQASNGSENVWASPSWMFAVEGAGTGPSLATPSGLSASAVSASRIDLNWTDNSTNETGFLIERSTTSGSGFAGIGSVAANVTSHSDSGVSAGLTYYYRVTATNSSGSSSASVEASATVPDAPPTVANSGAVSSNAASATVSGLLNEGGTGNAWICWGDNESGAGNTSDWDHVVSVGAVTESVPFSIFIDSLAENATYWYRCYVSNGGGSDWADSATSFSGTAQGNVGGGTASVETISSVYAHNEKDSYGGKPEDVITGTGFDDTDANTIPLEWPTNHPSLWRHQNTTQYREEWQSQCILDSETSANGKIGWAILDLGSVKNSLSELYVWNVREDPTRGTVSNNIYYASDPTVTPNHGPIDDSSADYDFGSGGWALLSSQEFNLSGRTGDDPADSIVSLGGVSARYIAIEIMSNGGHADRVGLAEVGITVSTPIGAQIANTNPTGITATSANLNGSLDAVGANCAVYACWGTSDGGTNMSSWAEASYVGSYADELASISHALSSLIRGQTYYYTFRAGDSWASPSWQFTTPAGGVLTTNHLIPYKWIDDTATNAVTDYEAEVMDDPDGDGFSTWEEYWSGTDPHRSDSHLKIDSVSFDGSNVKLEWENAEVGAGLPPLAIEANVDLATGTWVKVAEKTPVNGMNSWSNSISQKNLFYRLAVNNVP